MKKTLLILSLSLFFSSCSYTWRTRESCLDDIPVSEQIGVKKAEKVIEYEEVTSLDYTTLKEKKEIRIEYESKCYLTCQSGYSLATDLSGTSRCLGDNVPCLPEELPSGAVSGIKSLLNDGSGNYGACSVSACYAGFVLQADNTCAGVVPPPFFPPIPPPMIPPVSCAVDPSNPMCVP